MYDARKSNGGAGQSSLVFGLIIFAVVALAFFGILMMPKGTSNSKPAMPGLAQTDAEFLNILDDNATRKYVTTLTRVAPRSADKLGRDAADAIASGASDDELAFLVMQSLEGDMLKNVRHLAKADVKHFDAFLKMSKGGLRKLSSTRSKWCRGSYYEQFASQSPAQIEQMIYQEFGYGSGGYTWGIGLNTLLLEAIEDAKSNPKSYGSTTAEDDRAMQSLMMRMITNPQIMQLMALQGQDEATITRAVSNLDFCSLGVTGIEALQSLPKETRGRLWAEGFKQMKNGGLEKAMRQMGVS